MISAKIEEGMLQEKKHVIRAELNLSKLNKNKKVRKKFFKIDF